jgi:hypothetical protein
LSGIFMGGKAGASLEIKFSGFSDVFTCNQFPANYVEQRFRIDLSV